MFQKQDGMLAFLGSGVTKDNGTLAFFGTLPPMCTPKMLKKQDGMLAFLGSCAFAFLTENM